MCVIVRLWPGVVTVSVPRVYNQINNDKAIVYKWVVLHVVMLASMDITDLWYGTNTLELADSGLHSIYYTDTTLILASCCTNCHTD